MIMIRGRRLFIHRHERQIKGFSSPFLNTNTNPDPSTILVGRAYYGIGIETPGGPPCLIAYPVSAWFALSLPRTNARSPIK